MSRTQLYCKSCKTSFDIDNLPVEIGESLHRYVEHATKTGDFLRAVLANDLFGAMRRADLDNRSRIYEIVAYIYNNLPDTCWGSYSKVDEWLLRQSTK